MAVITEAPRDKVLTASTLYESRVLFKALPDRHRIASGEYKVIALPPYVHYQKQSGREPYTSHRIRG